MDISIRNFSEQDVADLLCMPQVLADLIDVCLGGDGAQSVAEIILQDTALSAKIIQAASKSCSTPLNPLEPVTSAIQCLGTPMITSIALQSARQLVSHRFTDRELSFQYQLWFSSQVSGLIARCLAPSVNYPHIEEAQLCGVLLNLGIQTLFVHEGEGYVDLDVNPWSSAIQCHLEEANYATNHLQIADKIIDEWQLDSLLVDAVRFLNVDITQIEQGSLLLRIARLVHQCSQNPQLLTPETEELAGRLFGFTQNEMECLCGWARGLYPSFGTLLSDPDRMRKDMAASLERVTEVSFVLADQEAARARLAKGKAPESLITIARNLYLENTPASEAIFFLLDQKSLLLTGILADGQPRLVGELDISMEAKSSLVSAALFSGKPVDSFTPPQPLTVTDHVLLRLCKSSGISCHPFCFEGRSLGAVVLGVSSEGGLKKLQSLQMRMFGQIVSTAIMEMSAGVQEHFSDSSSLLRRVSHEVNNPLTIIGNYTEVLSHSLAKNDGQELTDAIKKEVSRIDDIINYYLNQQEIPEFPEHRVDLNQLVLDAVAVLNDFELKPRQIAPHYKLQKNLDKVATNPVLIKQILVNLVKNAAEAVSDGGKVELATRDGYSPDRGTYCEIIVRDNGTGIDRQRQEKLFQPIISSKGVGHAGVGLSIVKAMADDVGGWISCHSSIDSGTSFHLQIPCRTE